MATITGNNNANTLNGDTDGDLNDIIDGLGNGDLINGLLGNDTIYGGSGADRLYGGNDNDLIYGGTGLDFVDGGSGNDTIFGGSDQGGDDTLYGGAGFDFLDYSDVGAVTVNLTSNTASGGGGTDVLGSIEGVIGGTGDDSITGDTVANHLIGNDGNDTLIGDAGADTLDGGTGNDSLSGGTDSDVITGGTGNDTIDGGSGDDVITAGPTVAAAGSPVALDFNWSAIGADNTDITNVTQNTGGINVNVTLTSQGDNFNLFDVQTSGNIFVEGGETFNPGSSGELRRDGNGEPTVVDINFSAVAGSGFEEEVENVQFRISDMDDAGWRDRVVIRAWDADGNEIIGGVVITESSGGDIVVSGGTASVVAGAGETTATDEGGSILITIAGPVARIEISYDNLETAGQVIYVSDIHFDAISMVDNDSVTGGDGNDTIFGGIGNDTLLGGADNDVLYGGADNDSLNGGTGNDTLFGDAGTDTMSGAAGNDIFVIANNAEVSSTGNDVILGGGGAAEGGTGAGQDTVTDYDVIDLSAFANEQVDVVYSNTDPENLVGTISIYQPGMPHIPANLIGVIDFSEIEKVIECFTPGTMIRTDRGDVAVEMLQPGDMVVTRDNGLQPLRWTGGRTLSMTELQANPELQPVRIAKGALAQGPSRTMLVSPQHRVLIEGARAELLFGEAEVLVPAKHLVGHIDATRALPAEGVTYIHVLFDSHEIVMSDGIWSESFQPAERTLSAMDAEVRAEVLALFPVLETDADAYVGARLSLKAHEARVLLAN
jgi:Ca2+-binding RTX toxin-like protein